MQINGLEMPELSDMQQDQILQYEQLYSLQEEVTIHTMVMLVSS